VTIWRCDGGSSEGGQHEDGNFTDYFSSRVGAMTAACSSAVCGFMESLVEVCSDAGMVYDIELQAHTLRFWRGVWRIDWVDKD
jgi:hypothetical protein